VSLLTQGRPDTFTDQPDRVGRFNLFTLRKIAEQDADPDRQ